MQKIKSLEELAKLIDHTNLDNLSTKKDINNLCEQAIHYGFYSVVVSPYYVEYAKNILKSSYVKVATVAGFPLGFTSPKSKKKEAKIALKNGIDELDMVINITALKEEDYKTLKKEIEVVKKVLGDKILKVIIEAEHLNNEEIIQICEIGDKSGADFIKTSTGMSGQIPKASNVNLIQKTVPNMKIKASGGIRDYKTAIRLVAAGADRIVTSSGDLILEEYKRFYDKKLVE